MTVRLRDVVVHQHRRLLNIIDRAESTPEVAAIRHVEGALVEHLDAEEQLIYPRSEALSDGARYGHEAHVVLRFALERVGLAGTAVERVTRLRVLRDLLVHHNEREEWVTLQLLESRLEPAKSSELARELAARLGGPVAKKHAFPLPQARRKER